MSRPEKQRYRAQVSDQVAHDDVPLTGGRFAGPVRRGQVVLRRSTSATANTAALLQHLEQAGFEQAPRHLGYASDGREQLSYVEGDSALPPYVEAVRGDEALVNVARTIRRFHDAAQSFVAPEPWRSSTLSAAGPTEIDCIGQGDLTPWNMIFRGPAVAAIWETQPSMFTAMTAMRGAPGQPPAT